MGRGSTQVLIRRVLESLGNGPRTATEISDETGLDRTAIIRYLELLKQSGFVRKDSEGAKKKFILSNTYRLDTYFGMPVSEEVNEMIDSLYQLIRKEWIKLTNRKLLKTTAQKIIYTVIRSCELKTIPVGWYIYGGICIKPYDYDNPYDFIGLSKDITACVKETVLSYSQNKFAYESKNQLYEEEEKILYKIKEKILSLLFSSRFSEKSMYIFQKKYSQFLRHVPRGDPIYDELLNEYTALLIDMTKNWSDIVNEKDDMLFAELKQKISLSFQAVWKLVALHNFKNDLRKYYIEGEIEEHFKLHINQAKEDLMEICSELNEMIPFEEPDDDDYRTIKNALKDLNKSATKQVDDKYLFKKAGLD